MEIRFLLTFCIAMAHVSRDWVVCHAIYAAISRLFERGFIDHNYANRKGLGTYGALAHCEHWRERYTQVLRVVVPRAAPKDATFLRAERAFGPHASHPRGAGAHGVKEGNKYAKIIATE